jgi:hypothetical protein
MSLTKRPGALTTCVKAAKITPLRGGPEVAGGEDASTADTELLAGRGLFSHMGQQNLALGNPSNE